MAKKENKKIDQVTKIVTKKTKKPTGLSIKRSGYNSFACEWKLGETYTGQQFAYATHGASTWRKYTYLSVTKGQTKKTITLNRSDFYPQGNAYCTAIRIAVGKAMAKNYVTKSAMYVLTPSEWVYKDIDLYAPKFPSLTATLSETYTNVTTFAWSVADAGNDSRYVFHDVQWESILVKDSSSSGASQNWGMSSKTSGTGSASGSQTITENTAVLANGSYTRWFRVRSRGMAGTRGWVYAYHTYARPLQAKINTKELKVQTTQAGGFQCYCKWTADSSFARPVDQTSVQYCLTVPDAGLSCPSGVSWSDANVSRDTGGYDAATFSIDDLLAEDQCLFVRVNTQHDTYVTYGLPALASIGKLKKPSAPDVSISTATHKATIECTNNSEVSDSFIAIGFKMGNESVWDIGIIPHGETTVTVQCPNWGNKSIAFIARAVVGTYRTATRADGADAYVVTARAQSDRTSYASGSIPTAPTNVLAVPTLNTGTVRVSWSWSWSGARAAELSWADHEDAWESTDEPDTYVVSNLNSSRWNIAGLATGKRWFFRVRLMSSEDDANYSPYSDIVWVDLSSTPVIPFLSLSKGVITKDEAVTASWSYSTTEVNQQYAEICDIADPSQTNPNRTIIARVGSAQSITIYPKKVGWSAGETHYLAIRAKGATGEITEEWSDYKSVVVATPLTCEISATSLEDATENEPELHLTDLPLTVKVDGAGDVNRTVVVVERAESYILDRPDENRFTGYEGEMVVSHEQTGDSLITFGRNDLLHHFDDGARYRITALVKDDIGQIAEATPVEFIVRWTEQAIMPEAWAVVDTRYDAVVIGIETPEGASQDATCDIYRLSSDKPELIYEGAPLGSKIVDPYPAIGESGGHRIVYKTANGDYITEQNMTAWVDLHDDEDDILDVDYAIIDFEGGHIRLYHNLDLSQSWDKDFKETAYLGGSVQGDWNPAISRTSSLSTTVIRLTESDIIMQMRRLAVSPTECHIRTPDGSSYAADIQVSESSGTETRNLIYDYSLKITRIDTERLDGLTLEEWQAQHEEQ